MPQQQDSSRHVQCFSSTTVRSIIPVLKSFLVLGREGFGLLDFIALILKLDNIYDPILFLIIAPALNATYGGNEVGQDKISQKAADILATNHDLLSPVSA